MRLYRLTQTLHAHIIAMHGHHSILLPAASKQMQEVTLRLVKESFGETYYDKALDCVKALRSEAVMVSLINQLSLMW
jgi:hypothetical protein